MRRASVGLALVLLLGAGAAVATHDGEVGASVPIVGRIAPPIEGSSLEGERIEVADWRGRWLVVSFFAPWCTECVVELPELDELASRLGTDGLVVSVIVGSTPDDVRSMLERHPTTRPFVVDPDGRTAVDYGQVKVPETFVIGPDSAVVAFFAEGTTAEQIFGVIDGSHRSP